MGTPHGDDTNDHDYPGAEAAPLGDQARSAAALPGWLSSLQPSSVQACRSAQSVPWVNHVQILRICLTPGTGANRA